MLLEGPTDAKGLDRGLDLSGFVANDADDLVGDSFRRGNDVQQKGPAADLVEDFGAAGFEARAFAGSHDNDSEG